VLAGLPRFLEKHPAVRVVVLDSVTFHFRYAESEMASAVGSRTRLLQSFAQTLHRVAATYNVAVVVTNQMTTRLGPADGGEGATDGGGSRLVPALGESWAHVCTNRVILRWEDGGAAARVAQLVKSPSLKPGEARYAVTPEGVRGYRPPAPVGVAGGCAADTQDGGAPAAAAATAQTVLGKRTAEQAGMARA
jgi:RAD51-like protein 2